MVFIRDVLEQWSSRERPTGFAKRWTGLGGRWTLAHAGHAGSNNNWVEVNWRDMEQLVPALATLATFTGALVKNISDLGIAHADSICRQGQPNLFPSVP